MGKWVLGSLVIVLCLSGCGRQEALGRETVLDTLPVSAEESQGELWQMVFEVPEDGVLETGTSGENVRLYLGANGDYELLAQAVSSDSIETVVRELSGFRYDELYPLHRTQHDLDRYDLAWAAQDDSGSRVCRAAVIRDGGEYYILLSSSREGIAEAQRKSLNRAFSTFDLSLGGGCKSRSSGHPRSGVKT